MAAGNGQGAAGTLLNLSCRDVDLEISHDP
jgi:hypothetical protein